MNTLKIFKTKDVKTPSRGTPKSAGIDFYVPHDFTSVSLRPSHTILIPSGIKARIPEGYALVANNKSGVATKLGIIVGASVVDEDYTGEIHIHLLNVGTQVVNIHPGQKIIQFILEKQEYLSVEVAESEEILFSDLNTERGDGGFGSTGVN